MIMTLAKMVLIAEILVMGGGGVQGCIEHQHQVLGGVGVEQTC